MKQVLKALSVTLILAGAMVAQQEVSPDVYPDKSPVTQHQAVAQKKQPAQQKAVVAKKAAPKATLVARRGAFKTPSTRSN